MRDTYEFSADKGMRTCWKFGGMEQVMGEYPGRARVARAHFTRSVCRAMWIDLSWLFADAPRFVATVLALLRILTQRSASIALPAPEPRALTPQRGCHRLTPARAP